MSKKATGLTSFSCLGRVLSAPYPPSRCFRLGLVLLVSQLLIIAGCAGPSRYSYESIRTEYAGQVCQVKSISDPASRQEASSPDCDIPSPLTLSDAIAIAMKNNPDLHRAAWRIEQAKAMRNLAGAAFWPAVGLYTEYMQGDAPSAYLFKKIDQRMLPRNVNFNDPGWFENFESGLKARVNLFNGGQDYLERQMADKDVDISRLDRTAIENNLSAEVIKAFYDVLASREFIRIAEDSIAAVSEQLRIMRVRYEGGSVRKADVLSMEVRLNQAREQRVQSQNRFRLAGAALGNLMGLDPVAWGGDQAVQGDVMPGPPEIPDTYEGGVAEALIARPELAKLREQLIKSRMGVDAARTGYLPRLDIMAKYYVDDPGMDYDTSRDNWSTAVLFNWDVFSGFSRSARIARADAMVKELLAAEHQAVLDVKLDVKRAYLNREAARARYEVAKSNVEAAEESFRLVREYFQGGSATITRYLEAELDRNQARVRRTAAYYNDITAAADVARAVGHWASRGYPTPEREKHNAE